jgi:type II secretory pathway pseudopilin PulG
MLTRRLRQRLAGEAGFTLIELLVGMTTGTIVLMATFGIVDAAMPAGQRVTDRVEASQVGRGAMEQAMQDLRSAVCVWQGGTTYLAPFSAGTSNANKVTFYRQVYAAPAGTVGGADPGKTGTVSPQLVELSVTNGQLVEKVWNPQGVGPLGTPTPAAWSWNTAGQPDTNRVLAPNVQQVTGANTDYFTYYAYATGAAPPTGGPPALSIGAGNVAAADLPRIVKVRLQFQAGPQKFTSNGTDHFVSLRDEASISLPVDFTSGDTASQGGKCTV